MAEIVIFNRIDPCIGITLREGIEGGPAAPGWHGSCTECGWPMHRWNREKAIEGAQAHVDAHSPVLIGGDTDALVRR